MNSTLDSPVIVTNCKASKRQPLIKLDMLTLFSTYNCVIGTMFGYYAMKGFQDDTYFTFCWSSFGLASSLASIYLAFNTSKGLADKDDHLLKESMRMIKMTNLVQFFMIGLGIANEMVLIKVYINNLQDEGLFHFYPILKITGLIVIFFFLIFMLFLAPCIIIDQIEAVLLDIQKQAEKEDSMYVENILDEKFL